MLSVNLTVITKKTFIMNIQRGTESKYNTKEKKLQGKGERSKKGRERNYKHSQKIINKIEISTYLLIITFSVNGLNAQIKIHRMTKWIKKPKTHLYGSYKKKTSFQT